MQYRIAGLYVQVFAQIFVGLYGADLLLTADDLDAVGCAQDVEERSVLKGFPGKPRQVDVRQVTDVVKDGYAVDDALTLKGDTTDLPVLIAQFEHERVRPGDDLRLYDRFRDQVLLPYARGGTLDGEDADAVGDGPDDAALALVTADVTFVLEFGQRLPDRGPRHAVEGAEFIL